MILCILPLMYCCLRNIRTAAVMTAILVLLCLTVPERAISSTKSTEQEFPCVEKAQERHNFAKRIEQCGVSSVYAILRCGGYDVTPSDVASRVPPEVFDRGMSVGELRDLLTSYSLLSKDVTGGLAEVNAHLESNAILIIPDQVNDHFLVYLRQKGDQYLRYNPPYSFGWVEKAWLQKDWQGYALAVHKASDRNMSENHLGALSRPTFLVYVAFAGGVVLFVLGFLLRRGKAISLSKR